MGSIKYVRDLASEYADYFGNVGVNFELQGINEAAATAFNWAKLVFDRPGTTEVLAFDVLQNALKPLLLKGEKPDATQFPHAQDTPSRREMNRQYLILCKRIRHRENVNKSFSFVTTLNVARGTPNCQQYPLHEKISAPCLALFLDQFLCARIASETNGYKPAWKNFRRHGRRADVCDQRGRSLPTRCLCGLQEK